MSIAADDLALWGLDARAAASLEVLDVAGTRARVIRPEGRGHVLVATASETRLATTDTPGARASGVGDAVTGDWVLVEGDDVVAVAERRSRIARLDPSDPRREQVLVANADIGCCLEALDREVSVPRLERLAALVWEGDAQPLVVLTKADLAADPDRSRAEVLDALVVVDVMVLSALTGHGLVELTTTISGKTVALLGPSGAGKSTLVNAVVGDTVQATREVRTRDAKGRHTTTVREVVPVGDGTVLIDTPGLRAVGMAESASGVAAAFSDIVELASDCRFRDCRHESEPGCAVVAAVAAGDLDDGRLSRFQALRDEAEASEIRADPVRARAARRRFSKQVREIPHRDPPGR